MHTTSDFRYMLVIKHALVVPASHEQVSAHADAQE